MSADLEQARLASLGRRFRVAFAWGAGGVILGRALQFLTTLLLAHFLAPSDFGALAVALVVQSVAINVTDLGATAAIGRGGDNSTALAPTVMTVSALTGAVLTATTLAAAPALAAALGNDEATPVVQVMSLTIFLAGLSGVPAAFVWRDYRQGPKAAVECAGAVVSLVSALILASLGWGAMSLAWSRLGGQLATTLGYWLISPVRVRPRFNSDDARSVLGLGLPLAAANLVVFLALNIDYAVVGHILGPDLLGYYLLAFTLSGLPSSLVTTAVRSVAVPSLGRLHVARRLSKAAPALLVLVCCLAMPAAAFVTSMAGSLVVVLYGGKWEAAIAPLIGLGVFSGGRIVTEFLADLSVGAGRTVGLFWIQVVWFAVLLPSIWLGASRWGLMGVGVAQAAVVWIAVLPLYISVSARAARLGAITLGRSVVLPLVVSTGAGLLAFGAAALVGRGLLALVLGAAVGGAVCAALLLSPARAAWRTLHGELDAVAAIEGVQG